MEAEFIRSRHVMMIIQLNCLNKHLPCIFQHHLLFCNHTREVVRVGPPDVPLVVKDAQSVGFKWIGGG